MNPSLNPYATWTWRWTLAWLNVRSHWRQLRWYWQRATRGWADCDVWGMSSYLCAVVVPMLQRLKQKPGTPGAFIPARTSDENADDEEAEALVAKGRLAWEHALDEMIAGFTAAAAIDDGPPKRFFTERDSAGYHAWEDAQRALQARGMQRFIDHFHSLWD